ncbi:MAG: MerR family transcriptional regulator [Thermosynechococcaceae cyanobacterium MS004]|nr:MerR family transcriptional regulator [Thermosynechococcaceae cyanobacterium MS004]
MKQRKTLIDGFSRREVISLTGCTSSRLAYLEKSGLIIPERVGETGRPLVLFSWEQLLEIRAIKNLRKDVSLQKVRKIIDFLNTKGYSESLRDKNIVVINDEVYWLDPGWSDLPGLMMKVAGPSSEGLGQLAYYELIVISSLNQLVEDVWASARDSKVVNFEAFKQRAKVKSRQVA